MTHGNGLKILFGADPAEGGNDAVADLKKYGMVLQLDLNKEFIVDECIAHVDNSLSKTATGINTVTNAIPTSIQICCT